MKPNSDQVQDWSGVHLSALNTFINLCSKDDRATSLEDYDLVKVHATKCVLSSVF